MIQKGLADFGEVYELQQPRLAMLGTHPLGELLIGLADGYSCLGAGIKKYLGNC